MNFYFRFVNVTGTCCLKLLLLFISTTAVAQQPAPPKLVVGIVVDQMRYDFIHRYWDKFGENGFKKLINEGFSCENAYYSYIPTYTGPGHATIYTGCTPSVHGICANSWYDTKAKKHVNCVSDPNHTTAGMGKVQHISPALLNASTIGDELRLATNFNSRVISIAIKDRGAVLPGGILANAAYWLDDEGENWISSDYYVKKLPDWVNAFNKQKLTDQYLSGKWETLLPIKEYTASIADNNNYERGLAEGADPVFPYDLPKLKEKLGSKLIKYTPWGNTLTSKLALEALKEEELGGKGYTDMLLISFSSTDYIGHEFGPRSVEVEDTYLRLDKELADFIATVESTLGRENVLIFLTADHGVGDVPAYLENHRIPAGTYQSRTVRDSLNARLKKLFNVDSLVSAFTNNQVYLDHKRLLKVGRNAQRVVRQVIAYLEKQSFVGDAVAARELLMMNTDNKQLQMARKGYYNGRSGDIIVITRPGWISSSSEKGATHGSGYSYDTHVPLIWYGWRIKAGSFAEEVHIEDIAPTISGILKISPPNAATGKPILLNVK